MKSISITESLAMNVKKYTALGRTDKQIALYLGVPVSTVQRAKNGVEIIICNFCGKSFQKTARGQRYCSDDCRKNAFEEAKANRVIIKPKRYCRICGKELEDLKRYYCSKECMQKNKTHLRANRNEFYLT